MPAASIRASVARGRWVASRRVSSAFSSMGSSSSATTSLASEQLPPGALGPLAPKLPEPPAQPLRPFALPSGLLLLPVCPLQLLVGPGSFPVQLGQKECLLLPPSPLSFREPPCFRGVQGVLGDPPPAGERVPLGLDLPGGQALQEAAKGKAQDLGDLRRGVEVPRHPGLRTRRTDATNWSDAPCRPEPLLWRGRALLPLPEPRQPSVGLLEASGGPPAPGRAGRGRRWLGLAAR